MQLSSLERPFTLIDLVSVGFRYKWRFALVSLVCLTLGLAAILVFPRKYESEAKLVVKLGRTSAALDPTTVGPTISIQESRDTEINSIIDLMTSRGLHERVVDRIGVDRILEKHSWLEQKIEEAQTKIASQIAERGGALASQAPSNEASPAESDLAASKDKSEELSEQDIEALKRRESAIDAVAKHLRISTPKKSTTISMAYRGGTPTLAREIVETAIECYKEMHIDAFSSDAALVFFNKRLAEQAELLKQQEDMLKQAKTENSIVTMRGKQESLQSEITNVKQMQLTTAADLESAKARVRNLEASLATLPEEMVSEKSSGNPAHASDLMRDRLFALELEEKELAEKYAESHPKLRKVREQIAEAQKVVNQQPEEREQSKVAANPVHLGIQNELLLAQSNVGALAARMEALAESEKRLNNDLSDTNRLELVSEDLQRQIEVGRETYRIYARKLEESKMNAALDQDAVSNVSIVNPPSLNYQAVSPNRKLLAALAGLFALCAGFTTALLSEFKARAREINELRKFERERLSHEVRGPRTQAALMNGPQPSTPPAQREESPLEV